jgi:HD-GYP domain-containing protein (c-di-GMP phosphodiesterase class II)
MKDSNETTVETIMDIEKQLNRIQDFDILLERLLTEARNLTHADAGSIYICEGSSLHIKYAQNDTLQANLAPGQKLPYVFAKFPPTEQSVAGYCVKTAETVNIFDVYHIPAGAPYGFNQYLDNQLGYRTKSLLTVPLYASGGETLGVLQIINALDKDWTVMGFTEEQELIIQRFALSASFALERARLTRTMVMRMVEMARFRDPTETSVHAQRVSHYAVEMYDNWAFSHQIAREESEKFRDALKIAAMLHDVGKVGIPDYILKKEGKLTEDEYKVIKTHTCMGASLFSGVDSLLDRVSREVALCHHEHWDGAGYPGGLSGEKIPLAARLVCLADVFDALSSRRVYKAPWNTDAVLAEIRAQRSRQFDPAVTDCFFQVLPRVLEIQAALPEE